MVVNRNICSSIETTIDNCVEYETKNTCKICEEGMRPTTNK